MKNDVLFCGVDVSKSTLDVIGINLVGDVILEHHQIKNSSQAIKTLFNKLKSQYGTDKLFVAFENTGVYSYWISLALSELNIVFYQLSPFAVNRSKGLQRGKTDKLDALIIARYALANQYKLSPTQLTEDVFLELRMLQTQREKIVQTIKIFGQNKETYEQTPKRLQRDLKKTDTSILNNLERNLKKLEAKIESVIKENEDLHVNYKLVQTIPGIGPQTAIYLIIATKGFKAFKNARKLACYAGVAPFPYQSGTSIKGRTKVHHMADKKLKSLIHMCALTSKKYDAEIKEYYDRKVAEGKNKMLVINNVRNKLLHRIFAVINRQQPYVNLKKYAA